MSTTTLPDLSARATYTRVTRASAAPFEVRADDDGKVTLDGTASVVDEPYSVRDMFGEYQETIVRGAFNKTLKEKADVRLLVNHDGVPLARTKSKTLKLAADPDLRATATLDPANPTVQEIRSALDRGDIDQMSIGMRVHRQEWNEDYTERWIREAELFDVSVVTFPASPTTSAKLRSLAELVDMFPVGCDVDPDEVCRAMAHLAALLPGTSTSGMYTFATVGDATTFGTTATWIDPRTITPVEPTPDPRRLVVTDELIALWQHRLSA